MDAANLRRLPTLAAVDDNALQVEVPVLRAPGQEGLFFFGTYLYRSKLP